MVFTILLSVMIVASLFFLVSVAPEKYLQRLRLSKLRRLAQPRLRLLFAIVTIGIAVALTIARSDNRPSTNTSQQKTNLSNTARVTKALDNPVPTPSGVGDYQLMSIREVGRTKRIQIFTLETSNAKLILLNDALYDHYKDQILTVEDMKTRDQPILDVATRTPKVTTLYIDYFDDKTVALSYFQKMANKKISKDEKAALTEHYTALTISSYRLGTTLLRQQPSTEVIKKYE